MERWKQYELSIYWFCMINFILIFYVSVQQGIGKTMVLPLSVQCLALIALASLMIKQRKNRSFRSLQMNDFSINENPLQLKCHEKIHEQKRHYQVAIAMIELGEREQAVAYIDTILQEIS